ncbi:MAG: RNA polymerase sigma factor [Candidatus Methylomirabilia bacterium]
MFRTGGESPDDRGLIAQVGHGSEEALVALHRRYVNLVYSLTLRILGDAMATEEVTQDVFMKVWRQPRAYDPNKGRFSSWLLTTARHLALDRLRQDGRRPPRLSTPHGKDEDAALERTIAKGNPVPETLQDLRITLGHLSSVQREVIELAYFGRMSQQDISDYLSLPLGTVKTRMRLGMQHLRAMWHQSPRPTNPS